MKDGAQTNENPSVTEAHHPVTRWTFDFFYLVGWITLGLAMTGTMYNDGTQDSIWLVLVIPLFIGVPATLLSMIQTLAYRLNRFCICAMLLLTHFLLLALNFVIGMAACC